MITPVTTEKAVRLIEAENVLLVETERKMRKPEIKKEFEETFGVKVDGLRTFVRGNKKYAYVKLNEKNPAIDIATRFGMI